MKYIKLFEIIKKLNTNFFKWFGNSKVVTDSKKPLVVYHGTIKKFTKFEKNQQIYGHHGKGFYFGDKNYAESYYGTNYIKCYLRINKLFDMFHEFNLDEIKILFGDNYKQYEDYINDELKYSFDNKLGGYLFYSYISNDILIKNGYDGIKHDFVYVVFEPNQIKSIDNDGSWDNDDDNIYS